MEFPPERMEQMAESLKTADRTHGREEISEAYRDFMIEVVERRNRSLWLRIVRSNDIGEALVQWHRMNSEAYSAPVKTMASILPHEIKVGRSLNGLAERSIGKSERVCNRHRK